MSRTPPKNSLLSYQQKFICISRTNLTYNLSQLTYEKRLKYLLYDVENSFIFITKQRSEQHWLGTIGY